MGISKFIKNLFNRKSKLGEVLERAKAGPILPGKADVILYRALSGDGAFGSEKKLSDKQVLQMLGAQMGLDYAKEASELESVMKK